MLGIVLDISITFVWCESWIYLFSACLGLSEPGVSASVQIFWAIAPLFSRMKSLVFKAKCLVLMPVNLRMFRIKTRRPSTIWS